MARAYLFKNEWQHTPGKPVAEPNLEQAIREQFPAGVGERRIRITRDGKVVKDWGPYKAVGEIRRNVEHQLKNGKRGDVVEVDAKKGPDGLDRKVRIVRLPQALDGVRVLAAIRSVWGAPYVFGGENGPNGMPGVFFDCSGLVDWAHNTVGVDLPHGSELIRTDPRVKLFDEQRFAKKGDLVIMHFGRLAAGVADHIGCWHSTNLMLDTRSPFDPVGSSAIEPSALMAYGRIESVNGKL